MSKNTYAYLEAAENLTFSYYGDRARYAALIGSFAPPNPTTLVDLVSNFDAAVISFVDTNNASIDGATDHDWLRKLRTLYAGIFGAETTAPDGRLLVAAIMHYGAGTIPNDPVFPATSNPGSCQNFLGANYKVAGNADYVPFLLIKDTNAALFSAFDSSMDSDGNANTTPCCTLVISKNKAPTDGHCYISAKLHRRTDYSEKSPLYVGNEQDFIKFPDGAWVKPYDLENLRAGVEALARQAFAAATLAPSPNPAAPGLILKNGSQIRLTYSEKARGAGLAANYTVKVNGAAVIAANYLDVARDPAGTDGFPASAIVAGTKETWVATLKNLASADTSISIEPSAAIMASNAESFAADADASLPFAYNVDNLAPTVIDVSSLNADGDYVTGATVSVDVHFSEIVAVTGAPRLGLELGLASPVIAAYSGGSGSGILSFSYTVAAGHRSSDLDYAATNSLDLNGGTIKDLAGNDTILSLAAPGAPHSLGFNKDIVVDTIHLSVLEVDSSTLDGVYKDPAHIDVTVKFSEKVFVAGTPRIGLELGLASAVLALYASGSGSDSLHFDYQIADTHNSADLDYASVAALALGPGGSIKDAAGNDALLALPALGSADSLAGNRNIIVDTVHPIVLDVGSSAGNGSYNAGHSIDITVRFSEKVLVTGTPQLGLELGAGSPVLVNYASGSGGDKLHFDYLVQDGQNSGDLDCCSANSLGSGGTIRDQAGNDAVRTLPLPGTPRSLGYNKDIVIDTVRPTIVGVCLRKKTHFPNAGAIMVELAFSEIVYAPKAPFGAKLVLKVQGIDGPFLAYASGSGSSKLVFLLGPPGAAALPHFPLPHHIVALYASSGYIRDRAGNDAILKFDQAITSRCSDGSCTLSLFCKISELCHLPLCSFSETCAKSVFCQNGLICPPAIACKPELFCKDILGCGLLLGCKAGEACPGSVGPCPNIDPPFGDWGRDGDPSPIDILLGRIDSAAAEGGVAGLDRLVASETYAAAAGKLDPASRRRLQSQVGAIRRDVAR